MGARNVTRRATSGGAATLPALVMVAALVTVVQSLGAPLIPSIARSEGVSLGDGQWLLTATLLSGALSTPAMGRLADGPHKRRVVEGALVVVLLGSLLAAASPDFDLLVVGRAMQGVGLGLLPVTMAIARSQLPPERTRGAVATLSVTAAAGAGLGYPLTAFLAQSFGWRGAYWFGAIVVGLTLAVVLLLLPGRYKGNARPFDLLGLATLGASVAGVTLVLSEGHAWGWTSPASLGTLGACALLVVAWRSHELRIEDPLIDVRQLRNRSVLTADVAGILVAAAMYLFLPIIVELVQIPTRSGYGFGSSVLTAGLVLVPLSVASLVASRGLAAFELRFGARAMIPFGSLVFGAGALLFVLAHGALWEAFVSSGVAGIGLGFTFAAMPGFIVRAVPPGETGSATALYQVLRSTGLSFGSALAASLLASATKSGHAFPDFSGFRSALLVAIALCLLAAALGYVLPGGAAPGRSPVPAGPDQLRVGGDPVETAVRATTVESLAAESGTGP